MQTVSLFIYAFTTIFSLGLLIVSIASFRKYKNTKLLFVSFVFLVLFIKSILFSFSLLYEGFNLNHFSPYLGLFDFIILILLFIATLKR